MGKNGTINHTGDLKENSHGKDGGINRDLKGNSHEPARKHLLYQRSQGKIQ